VSRIYWDTMLFIYWLEDHPHFARRVGEIRARMNQRHDELITSSFTFGEILAGIYRKPSGDLVAADVKRSLESTISEVIPFDVVTADHYGRIRGELGVPPADAIHLASAARAGTDLFLTNDKRLVGKVVPGIQFIAPLEAPLF